uniref:Uncharacterized protein n=1 Tax=Parascaris univalens TaxID=6257 RepID=A0A915C8W9_PARUN
MKKILVNSNKQFSPPQRDGRWEFFPYLPFPSLNRWGYTVAKLTFNCALHRLVNGDLLVTAPNDIVASQTFRYTAS